MFLNQICNSSSLLTRTSVSLQSSLFAPPSSVLSPSSLSLSSLCRKDAIAGMVDAAHLTLCILGQQRTPLASLIAKNLESTVSPAPRSFPLLSPVLRQSPESSVNLQSVGF